MEDKVPRVTMRNFTTRSLGSNNPMRCRNVKYCGQCGSSDLEEEHNHPECRRCDKGWHCDEECRLSKVYCNVCKTVLYNV